MNIMSLESIKQTINNIRGAEMALSTVITIVLLLIVLIVAASFFIGGSEGVLNPIMGVGDAAAGQAGEAQNLNWLQ
jgi:hypothetical protein